MLLLRTSKALNDSLGLLKFAWSFTSFLHFGICKIGWFSIPSFFYYSTYWIISQTFYPIAWRIINATTYTFCYRLDKCCTWRWCINQSNHSDEAQSVKSNLNSRSHTFLSATFPFLCQCRNDFYDPSKRICQINACWLVSNYCRFSLHTFCIGVPAQICCWLLSSTTIP